MVVAHRRSKIELAGYDYADAFEAPLRPADTRSAEELYLAGLEAMPAWLGVVVLAAHRHILRLQLAPPSAPNHLLGWEVLAADHDSITLKAAGPLIRGVLIARRATPSTAVLETFVSYRRPVLARLVWAAVGPMHRKVGPYLLRLATESACR